MNTYECDGCGRLMRWGSEGPSPVRQEQDTPQWTTEPPTDPGWYWGVPQRADCKPEMMEVIDDDGQLMVAGNIYDVPLSDHVGWLWLRIEAPEPPK